MAANTPHTTQITAVLVQEAVGHVLVAEHDAGDEGGAGQQHCIVVARAISTVMAASSRPRQPWRPRWASGADDYQVLGHVGENYTDDNNDQREDEYALALKHRGESTLVRVVMMPESAPPMALPRA